MRNFTVNSEQLFAVSRGLGDLVVDPGMWPVVLEQFSAAAGATGAALLRSDVRTPDNPRTASMDENIRNYFATGWHTRDTLLERIFPLLMRGRKVISDQDVVTAEEMRRLDFYNEVLVPFGFQWGAGIGFWAGPTLWAVIMLRSPRQGPFEQHEKAMLARLAPRLSETATLSGAVGGVALLAATNALHLVGQPALVFDRLGFVLDLNAGAGRLFDDELYVGGRRLIARDQKAASALGAFIDQVRATPDAEMLPVAPIVVRRSAKPPLVIRVLPVDGAARSPFLGARALLTFSPIEPKCGPDVQLISDLFGLTRAEAVIAALVVQGKSLAAIADERGVARVSVRNQIKTIFAKTGTHRQSELAALLSRL
jgi:DNA-binding CsgD family transcriptional regulator